MCTSIEELDFALTCDGDTAGRLEAIAVVPSDSKDVEVSTGGSGRKIKRRWGQMEKSLTLATCNRNFPH